MRTSFTLFNIKLLIAATCTIAACAQTPPPAHLDELSRLTYPKDTELGEDLNIIVVRKHEQIEVANLSPQAFDDVLL